MLDLHTIPAYVDPAHWGVHPILFSIGTVQIPSYEFFVMLAIIVGGLVFWYLAKKQKVNNENTFLIGISALLGGALGAKILELLVNPTFIIEYWGHIEFFLSGRTILGGLIGGLISVKITKRYLGISIRRGNLFAPAVAIGVAIGRIGCFLRGCCYGLPTSLPWGVDFGDGILRHPTELYESAFMLVLFVYLWIRLHDKKHEPKPGSLFTLFLNSYFIFRFFIEFIRVEPIFAGLSVFQWVCILGLIFVNWKSIVDFLCNIFNTKELKSSKKITKSEKSSKKKKY